MNRCRGLAFTSTNDEGPIDAAKTAPNDVNALLLTSELARNTALIEIPKKKLIRRMIDERVLRVG